MLVLFICEGIATSLLNSPLTVPHDTRVLYRCSWAKEHQILYRPGGIVIPEVEMTSLVSVRLRRSHYHSYGILLLV